MQYRITWDVQINVSTQRRQSQSIPVIQQTLIYSRSVYNDIEADSTGRHKKYRDLSAPSKRVTNTQLSDAHPFDILAMDSRKGALTNVLRP
jgi:hypothetical protein